MEYLILTIIILLGIIFLTNYRKKLRLKKEEEELTRIEIEKLHIQQRK